MPPRPSVLVCEDNADLAENLRELIELLDLDVHCVADVASARECLDREASVGLLLTDLRIGVDSGLDLLRHAREEDPELPVILVSGFLDDETRATARGAGVNALFDKPVDHEALLATVQDLVSRASTPAPPRDLRSASDRAERTRERIAGGPLAGVDLLIVDDNVDLAENLGEFLSELGAEVRYARSCAEARAAAAPDVSLIDIRLPDGSGAALVSQLRNGRSPEGEALLITGHASLDGAISALRQGANNYLLKPIDLDELEASVRRAAETVRMRQREHELTRRLQESEAKLRTLVDHTQVLLVALDPNQCVVQANAAVEAITGWGQEQLLGADWVANFVREPERAQARENLMAAARRPDEAPLVETLVAADGKLRQISWLSRPLPSSEGTWMYRAGLDVTDQLADQARANRAEKLAAIGTLAAGLAHEIRNPLNGASLQLQVLERRMGRAQVEVDWRGPVNVVREEVARLGRLVQEFMSFARPRALEPRNLSLATLLNKTQTLCAQDAKERGVSLELGEFSPKLEVAGDTDRLTQVFLNLTRNAIEASPEGSAVEITVDELGASVLVCIRDHGAGIPKELLDRVFEPFFTTKEGGTGLGLAICHAIVEQHGGRMRFVVENGTRAELTLPRA